MSPLRTHFAWSSPLAAAAVLILLAGTESAASSVVLEARAPQTSPAPASALEFSAPERSVVPTAPEAIAKHSEAPVPVDSAPALVVTCPDLAPDAAATLYLWPQNLDLKRALARHDSVVCRVPVVGPEGTPVAGLDPSLRYAAMVVGSGWVTPYPVEDILADGRTVVLPTERLVGAKLELADTFGKPVQRPSGFIQDAPQESRSRPHGATTFGPSSVQTAVVLDAFQAPSDSLDARDLLLCAVPDGTPPPQMIVRLSVPGCLPRECEVLLAPVESVMPVVMLALDRYEDRSGSIALQVRGGQVAEGSGAFAYAPAELLLTSTDHVVDGRSVRLRSALDRLDAESRVLQGVPEGTYVAELRPRLWRMLRFRPEDSVLRAEVQVGADGQAELDFDLGSVGAVDVHATVDGQAWGGPLDVEIRLRGEGRWCPVRWRSGGYRLDALPVGNYDLRIRSGFLDTDRALEWPEVPVTVRTDQVQSVTLTMQGGTGA